MARDAATGREVKNWRKLPPDRGGLRREGGRGRIQGALLAARDLAALVKRVRCSRQNRRGALPGVEDVLIVLSGAAQDVAGHKHVAGILVRAVPEVIERVREVGGGRL